MLHLGLLQSEADRKKSSYGGLLRITERLARCAQMSGAIVRCWNNEGQTLVETAISLSLLFTFVFGLIQVGFAFYSYQFVAESAREGSRYAMVRGSSCVSPCTAATSASVQTYVQNLGYPGLNSSNLTVTTTWPDTGTSCTPSVTPCNNPGNNVKVEVAYSFPFSILFIPFRTLTLTSTSEVVISQ